MFTQIYELVEAGYTVSWGEDLLIRYNRGSKDYEIFDSGNWFNISRLDDAVADFLRRT